MKTFTEHITAVESDYLPSFPKNATAPGTKTHSANDTLSL